MKPATLPPGHCPASAQRYSITPSRKESEGTLRTTGVSDTSLSRSKLPKKNSLSFRIGPPRAPPKIFLSSLGALLGSPDDSCASLRKYSFDDHAVSRCDQYPEPRKLFVPLLVTSDTCAALERPESAPKLDVVTRNSCRESSVTRTALEYAVPNCGSLTSTPSSVTLLWSARAPLTEPLRGSSLVVFGMYTAPACRLSSPTTLRASSGSCATWLPVMTLPRLASVVLSGDTRALTSIVSLCAPISIGTSILVRASTASTTLSRTAVRNPGNSTRTS